MKGTRVPLTLALFFLALLLFAFWIVDLVSGQVWLVFRRAAGLDTTRTIAQLAAALTVLMLFAAAMTIAVPVALEPAGRFRKWLNVLPAYLLTSTFAAGMANLLGLATLGSLLDMQSAVKISLAAAWLAASAVLGIIAVLIHQPLVLVIAGGVFVMEAGSSMLQTGWFRFTRRRYGNGRRLFLMVPIHHHFE